MSGVLDRLLGRDPLKTLTRDIERLRKKEASLTSGAATATSRDAGVFSGNKRREAKQLQATQAQLELKESIWRAEMAKRNTILSSLAILETPESKIFTPDEKELVHRVRIFIEEQIRGAYLAKAEKSVVVQPRGIDLSPRHTEDLESQELREAIKVLLDKLFYRLVLGENKPFDSDEVKSCLTLASVVGGMDLPSSDAMHKIFDKAIDKGYIDANADSYKIFRCTEKLSERVRSNFTNVFATFMLEGLKNLQKFANDKDFCKPEDKEINLDKYTVARENVYKEYLTNNPILHDLQKKYGLNVDDEVQRGVERCITDPNKEVNDVTQINSQKDLPAGVKMAFYLAVKNAQVLGIEPKSDSTVKFWRVAAEKIGIESREIDDIQRNPAKFSHEQNIPLSFNNEFERNYREQALIAGVEDALPVQKEKSELFNALYLAIEGRDKKNINAAFDELKKFAQKIVDENPLVMFIKEHLVTITKTWNEMYPTRQTGMFSAYKGNSIDQLVQFKSLFDTYRDLLFESGKEPDGKLNSRLSDLEKRLLDQASALKEKLRKESTGHEIFFAKLGDKAAESEELRIAQKGISNEARKPSI